MASEIHQNDVGTRFSITVKDDGSLVNISGVSGGSVHQVSFRKPSDTVRIKFATPTDASQTVAKVKKINKTFARKIQILTVGEQRAKVMGKNKVAAIFKKGKEEIRKKNERSNTKSA